MSEDVISFLIAILFGVLAVIYRGKSLVGVFDKHPIPPHELLDPDGRVKALPINRVLERLSYESANLFPDISLVVIAAAMSIFLSRLLIGAPRIELTHLSEAAGLALACFWANHVLREEIEVDLVCYKDSRCEIRPNILNIFVEWKNMRRIGIKLTFLCFAIACLFLSIARVSFEW